MKLFTEFHLIYNFRFLFGLEISLFYISSYDKKSINVQQTFDGGPIDNMNKKDYDEGDFFLYEGDLILRVGFAEYKQRNSDTEEWEKGPDWDIVEDFADKVSKESLEKDYCVAISIARLNKLFYISGDAEESS